jgi:hypothetical protein
MFFLVSLFKLLGVCSSMPCPYLIHLTLNQVMRHIRKWTVLVNGKMIEDHKRTALKVNHEVNPPPSGDMERLFAPTITRLRLLLISGWPIVDKMLVRGAAVNCDIQGQAT